MEFDDQAALRGWVRHEIREGAASDAFAVDPGLLDVAVSARAKRRAGACRYTPLPDGEVGVRPDWERTDARHREATLVIARRAATNFDEGDLRGVVHHELLHAEQVQAYGVTDHGPRFRERAAALGVPLDCPPFADPAFVLSCRECGETVGRRYRRCPTVDAPENYRTRCCDAPLAVADRRE